MISERSQNKSTNTKCTSDFAFYKNHRLNSPTNNIIITNDPLE